MMISKLRILICIFALLTVELARADWFYATVAVTNIAGTTNGQTLTVAGAATETRTWTNAVFVATTQILTNNTLSGAGANLFSQVSSHPFNGFQLMSAANGFTIRSNAAFTVTLSAGWGSLTYQTNPSPTAAGGIAVTLPYAENYTVEQQTNLISNIVAWVNSQESTNKYFIWSNKASGEWTEMGNNFFLVSNALNGKYVLLSNGVVTATSLSGSLGGSVPLTNAVLHYGFFNTNDETHDYFQSTNDMGLGSNAVTGESWRLTNGFALLSAGIFTPTNAVNTGTLQVGKPYETNITGNITLGLLAGVTTHADQAWSVWIFATNSTSTDHTVTLMAGTKELGNAPAVFTITNQQCADIIIYGWGNKKTNVAYYPHGY